MNYQKQAIEVRTVKRLFTSILCILLCFAMLITCETAVATALACEKDTSNVTQGIVPCVFCNPLLLGAGSYYAAGMPFDGEAFANEMNDQKYVYYGFSLYNGR